ncbi:MAG: FecCD family ABC transporter permease [Acidimicrobiales bacterium]
MTSRTGPATGAGGRRPFAVRHIGVSVVAAAAVVAALFVAAVAVGSVSLSVAEVWDVVAGHSDDSLHRTIVLELRLPRALVAAVAGAMLGLSGAVLQSITRNSLAAPELTGVSAGVILLTVVWLAYGPAGTMTGRIVPLVAVVGGVAAAMLAYALSRRGRSDPLQLILAGVLISAILQSATSLIVLVHQGPTGGVLNWTIGSLNARTWTHWNVLWPWAAVTVAATLLSASRVNALQLGDDVAAGLGVRAEPTRAVLLVLSALLAAGALAVVGAIGFVGLIAPHIARQFVADDARRLFPFTLLVGAVVLLGADVAARAVTNPIELPTGVVTTALGAVFFLHLLTSETR